MLVVTFVSIIYFRMRFSCIFTCTVGRRGSEMFIHKCMYMKLSKNCLRFLDNDPMLRGWMDPPRLHGDKRTNFTSITQARWVENFAPRHWNEATSLRFARVPHALLASTKSHWNWIFEKCAATRPNVLSEIGILENSLVQSTKFEFNCKLLDNSNKIWRSERKISEFCAFSKNWLIDNMWMEFLGWKLPSEEKSPRIMGPRTKEHSSPIY